MAYDFFKTLTEAKLHSHMNFQQMDISVEIPAGGKRTGTNKATGEKWEHPIDDHYGYIKGTHSPDGEHLDCYVRKNPDKNAKVYVMHQMTVDGSKFDEDKVMLGYSSASEAKRAFKKFTFKPKDMFGGMTEFELEHFLVVAYQASNSSAMLTTTETYDDFVQRGLMPRGVCSPLTVARRVCEDIETEETVKVFESMNQALLTLCAYFGVDWSEELEAAADHIGLTDEDVRAGRRDAWDKIKAAYNELYPDGIEEAAELDYNEAITKLAGIQEKDGGDRAPVSPRDWASKLAALKERQDPYGLVEFAKAGENGDGSNELRFVTCDWGYVDFIEMMKSQMGWSFGYQTGEPVLTKGAMIISNMREYDDDGDDGEEYQYTAFTVEGDIDDAELKEIVLGFECTPAQLDETLMSVNPSDKRRSKKSQAGYVGGGWYGWWNHDDSAGGVDSGGGDAGGGE